MKRPDKAAVVTVVLMVEIKKVAGVVDDLDAVVVIVGTVAAGALAVALAVAFARPSAVAVDAIPRATVIFCCPRSSLVILIVVYC